MSARSAIRGGGGEKNSHRNIRKHVETKKDRRRRKKSVGPLGNFPRGRNKMSEG